MSFLMRGLRFELVLSSHTVLFDLQSQDPACIFICGPPIRSLSISRANETCPFFFVNVASRSAPFLLKILVKKIILTFGPAPPLRFSTCLGSAYLPPCFALLSLALFFTRALSRAGKICSESFFYLYSYFRMLAAHLRPRLFPHLRKRMLIPPQHPPPFLVGTVRDLQFPPRPLPFLPYLLGFPSVPLLFRTAFPAQLALVAF